MSRTDRLVHPGVVGAVAVLAVNDHLLKGRWPGLLTGKVSDLAGLYLVAAVAAVLATPGTGAATQATGTILRARAGCAVAASGCAFAALKLSPPVALAAAPLLGGVTGRDPTDLAALAVLAPAYRHALWSCALGRRPGSAMPGGPDPVRGGRPRAVLRTSAVGLALVAGTLAVTATSCLPAMSVLRLVPTDDGVLAGLGEPSAPSAATGGEPVPLTWYRSPDGGRTWKPADLAAEPAPSPPRTETCPAPDRCYRVIVGQRVEERIDGQWRTAFAFTPDQRSLLERQHDPCSGHGDPDDQFTQLATAPAGGSGSAPDTTPAGGTATSTTVVVSMGTQGILRLDPVTGVWTRHAVGPAEPSPLRGPAWLARLTLTPFVLLALSPALYLVRRSSLSSRRRLAHALAAAVAALVIGLAAVGAVVVSFGRLDPIRFGLVVAAVSGLALLATFALALVARPPVPRPGSPPPPSR